MLKPHSGGDTVKEEHGQEAKGPALDADSRKTVSFREAGGGPKPNEQFVLDKLRKIADYIPEEKALQLIRSLAERGKDPMGDGFVNEVVDKYFQEYEVDPTRSVTPMPKNSVETVTQTDEDNEVQRAIEESKKISETFTGDGDISKAIQQSIIESSQAQHNSYARSLPENPHDMERSPTDLVGLFNIGNSCWFNCLAQLLFSIPEFRRIVYESVPSNCNGSLKWSGDREDVSVRELLLSMRRLFANMEASRRKYIDPTETVSILGALREKLDGGERIVGRQQDATEMLIKMIEWLEPALIDAHSNEQKFGTNLTASLEIDIGAHGAVAFEGPSSHSESVSAMDISPATAEPGQYVAKVEIDAADTSSQFGEARLEPQFVVPPIPEEKAGACGGDDRFSPLERLFHGTSVSKRGNDKENTSRQTKNTLQMWHLDVSYGNLHDSLEATQFSNHREEEVWFDQLPAILVFTPNRFQYKGGNTQKLHNEFHCPDTIFMDRYLLKNHDFVKSIRDRRNSNRKTLSEVKASLRGFDEFPVGAKTDHLHHILEAAGSYLSRDKEIHRESAPCELSMDTSAAAPAYSPPELNAQFAFPLPGPISFGPPNRNEPFPCVGASATKELAPMSSFVPSSPTVLPSCGSLNPDSRNMIIDVMMEVIADAKQNEAKLRASAEQLERDIESAFEQESLQQDEYRLHCVVIHEGDANTGHYWAFIKDQREDGEVAWRKFNDKTVETCKHAVVEGDAVGGVDKTSSAYCYVYVSSRAHWMFEFGGPELQTVTDGSSGDVGPVIEPPTIPEDLLDAINAENREYADMILRYDEKLRPVDLRSEYFLDPDSTRCWLVEQVYPILTDHEKEETKQRLHVLHDCVDQLSGNSSADSIVHRQAVSFYNSIGHHIIYLVDKQLGLDLVNSERGNATVFQCLTNWIDLYFSISPPAKFMNDPRNNIIEWWHVMGRKMPAKVFQLIIAYSLKFGSCTNCAKLAAAGQIDEFMTQITSSEDHVLLFEEVTYSYEVLHHFWAVFKEAVTQVSIRPYLPRHLDSNAKHIESLRTAHRNLKFALISFGLYETLVAGDVSFNVDVAVVPSHRLYTVLMSSLLVMSARLCIVLAKGCYFPRSYAESEWSEFFTALQKLVQLRDRVPIACKVLDVIKSQWSLLDGQMVGRIEEDKEKAHVSQRVCETIGGNFTSVPIRIDSIKVNNVALMGDITIVNEKCLNSGLQSKESCEGLLDGLFSDAVDIICHYLFP